MSNNTPMVLPPCRVPIVIREAVAGDIDFIDGLQKKNTKRVGFMPRTQLLQKIERGDVLVAEVDRAGVRGDGNAASSLSTLNYQPTTFTGYLIGNDRYFKRDDVGIIYQVNVVEEYRRSLVAANLLKKQFERSAYGCKLYCCWCAQDIEANRFWESMGFVPLAYRAGSESRGKKKATRVHIFWQKRIRQNDATTPWWYPCKTDAGAMRADRIVLPIPLNASWSDELPMILPNEPVKELAKIDEKGAMNQVKKIKSSQPRVREVKVVKESVPATKRVQFGPPGLVFQQPVQEMKKVEPRPVVVKEKIKTDPQLIRAARELRDRWLDEINADSAMPVSKYDVTRVMRASATMPLLAA